MISRAAAEGGKIMCIVAIIFVAFLIGTTVHERADPIVHIISKDAEFWGPIADDTITIYNPDSAFFQDGWRWSVSSDMAAMWTYGGDWVVESESIYYDTITATGAAGIILKSGRGIKIKGVGSGENYINTGWRGNYFMSDTIPPDTFELKRPSQ
jgi:hypothetical protein